ncbi:MAG TPA: DUF1800 domain-containing protein [Vicinamibacterales bacterium]|nr:DUF1800 domain-containing protein [Vicinamibacterales bacterium]
MRTTSFTPGRIVRVVALASMFALSSGLLNAQRSAIPAKADARTVAHVLDRLGFGARPGDAARVQDIGLAAYIEQQLYLERIADGALVSRLSEFPTLTMSASQLSSEYFNPATQARRQAQQQEAAKARAQGNDATMAAGTPPPPPPPAQQTPEMRMLQQQAQSPINELMQAKILRATLSERQLEEVLVDFWFNHFNVFVGKGQVREFLTEYERDAIRPNVLGNFRTLLGATAHSPAMLFYLDNFQSSSPNGGRQGNPNQMQRLMDPRLSPAQRRQIEARMGEMQAPNPQQRPQRGLNENYGRELMELHTLGVDSGYTQQDVIEAAKILTGWTIDRPQQGGGYVFRPQMHEGGSKTVLGQKFKEDGEKEGERLLDMLAMHPATAKHISFKLAQRFVADEPPQALVDRAAKRFLDTKGDLREVTRTIITSPEFFDAKYRSAKVKTPLEFVISAARATNAHIMNAQPMVQALRELGMPLYGAQPPTGYSMTADAWVNTGALLNRMNFAVQMLAGGQPQRMGGPGPNGQGRPNQGPDQPPPPQRQLGGRQGRGALDPRPGQLQRGPIQVDVRTLAPDTSEGTIDKVIDSVLGGQASDGTRQTIARATTPQQLLALALGSPEFQKR